MSEVSCELMSIMSGSRSVDSSSAAMMEHKTQPSSPNTTTTNSTTTSTTTHPMVDDSSPTHFPSLDIDTNGRSSGSSSSASSVEERVDQHDEEMKDVPIIVEPLSPSVHHEMKLDAPSHNVKQEPLAPINTPLNLMEQYNKSQLDIKAPAPATNIPPTSNPALITPTTLPPITDPVSILLEDAFNSASSQHEASRSTLINAAISSPAIREIFLQMEKSAKLSGAALSGNQVKPFFGQLRPLMHEYLISQGAKLLSPPPLAESTTALQIMKMEDSQKQNNTIMTNMEDVNSVLSMKRKLEEAAAASAAVLAAQQQAAAAAAAAAAQKEREIALAKQAKYEAQQLALKAKRAAQLEEQRRKKEKEELMRQQQLEEQQAQTAAFIQLQLAAASGAPFFAFLPPLTAPSSSTSSTGGSATNNNSTSAAAAAAANAANLQALSSLGPLLPFAFQQALAQQFFSPSPTAPSASVSPPINPLPAAAAATSGSASTAAKGKKNASTNNASGSAPMDVSSNNAAMQQALLSAAGFPFLGATSIPPPSVAPATSSPLANIISPNAGSATNTNNPLLPLLLPNAAATTTITPVSSASLMPFSTAVPSNGSSSSSPPLKKARLNPPVELAPFSIAAPGSGGSSNSSMPSLSASSTSSTNTSTSILNTQVANTNSLNATALFPFMNGSSAAGNSTSTKTTSSTSGTSGTGTNGGVFSHTGSHNRSLTYDRPSPSHSALNSSSSSAASTTTTAANSAAASATEAINAALAPFLSGSMAMLMNSSAGAGSSSSVKNSSSNAKSNSNAKLNSTASTSATTTSNNSSSTSASSTSSTSSSASSSAAAAAAASAAALNTALTNSLGSAFPLLLPPFGANPFGAGVGAGGFPLGMNAAGFPFLNGAFPPFGAPFPPLGLPNAFSGLGPFGFAPNPALLGLPPLSTPGANTNSPPLLGNSGESSSANPSTSTATTSTTSSSASASSTNDKSSSTASSNIDKTTGAPSSTSGSSTNRSQQAAAALSAIENAVALTANLEALHSSAIRAAREQREVAALNQAAARAALEASLAREAEERRNAAMGQFEAEQRRRDAMDVDERRRVTTNAQAQLQSVTAQVQALGVIPAGAASREGSIGSDGTTALAPGKPEKVETAASLAAKQRKKESRAAQKAARDLEKRAEKERVEAAKKAAAAAAAAAAVQHDAVMHSNGENGGAVVFQSPLSRSMAPHALGVELSPLLGKRPRSPTHQMYDVNGDPLTLASYGMLLGDSPRKTSDADLINSSDRIVLPSAAAATKSAAKPKQPRKPKQLSASKKNAGENKNNNTANATSVSPIEAAMDATVLNDADSPLGSSPNASTATAAMLPPVSEGKAKSKTKKEPKEPKEPKAPREKKEASARKDKKSKAAQAAAAAAAQEKSTSSADAMEPMGMSLIPPSPSLQAQDSMASNGTLNHTPNPMHLLSVPPVLRDTSLNSTLLTSPALTNMGSGPPLPPLSSLVSPQLRAQRAPNLLGTFSPNTHPGAELPLALSLAGDHAAPESHAAAESFAAAVTSGYGDDPMHLAHHHTDDHHHHHESMLNTSTNSDTSVSGSGVNTGVGGGVGTGGTRSNQLPVHVRDDSGTFNSFYDDSHSTSTFRSPAFALSSAALGPPQSLLSYSMHPDSTSHYLLGGEGEHDTSMGSVGGHHHHHHHRLSHGSTSGGGAGTDEVVTSFGDYVDDADDFNATHGMHVGSMIASPQKPTILSHSMNE